MDETNHIFKKHLPLSILYLLALQVLKNHVHMWLKKNIGQKIIGTCFIINKKFICQWNIFLLTCFSICKGLNILFIRICNAEVDIVSLNTHGHLKDFTKSFYENSASVAPSLVRREKMKFVKSSGISYVTFIPQILKVQSVLHK